MESKQVQVIESSSFVAPREATPTKGLWLSPLDLAAARGHTPLVYLYRSGAAFVDVARLKEAMSKALVPFYPLAGRLGINGDGRVEISCHGEGALFVVARSSLTAEDVDFSRPSPQLRGMFVPRIEPSSLIMATQVTFLKCGAVALGVAVHHAAVDGPSTCHFMQTWSAISRHGDAAAAVELPCHDRTLIRARTPPITLPATCPRLALSDSSEPTSTEVFTISRGQLAALKRLCGGASTFCSVGALVWRCATAARARRLSPRATACLSFPADVRRRVRPPLPARYFGNAQVSLCAAGAVAEVASEAALATVAGRIGRRHRQGGRRARAVRDRPPRAGRDRDGHPATEGQLAGDGDPDSQLARHAAARRGFRQREPAGGVKGGLHRQRVCARHARRPLRRPRGHVHRGCKHGRLQAAALCKHCKCVQTLAYVGVSLVRDVEACR
ncbi:unnamed protein product [Urochloa humidicola]